MSGRTASLRHRSRSRSPCRTFRCATTASSPGLLPTPQSPSNGPQALYLSYPQTAILPSDSKLERVFRRYGPILGVYVHRTSKAFVTVDYHHSSDAFRAFLDLSQSDHSHELGDSRLTISLKPTVLKEEQKPVWTGLLAVSGRSPVTVTAAGVEGDCAAIFSCFARVAVTHRAPVNEVLMRDSLAVVVFTGATDESKKELSEVAEYFYSKQRAGFASLQKYALYLLPPGPESFRYVSIVESHQLVGVLVDSSPSA